MWDPLAGNNIIDSLNFPEPFHDDNGSGAGGEEEQHVRNKRKAKPPPVPVGGSNSNTTEEEQCDIPEEELDMCHLQNYDTIQARARIVCEIVTTIWSFFHLVIAIREYGFLGKAIFMENMVLCPSRVLFLVACLLLQVAILIRIL